MGAAVQKSYNLEEIEAGLHELAEWNGSAVNASRTLKERGVHIPSGTLQAWKTTTYADRYADIEANSLPAIREKVAGQQAEIARRASEVTLKLVERTAEQIDEIPARDLPAAGRNLGTIAAIAIDKHAQINQLPTEVVRHEHIEDIFQRLDARWPGSVAWPDKEIQDAEVVEGSTAEGSDVQLPRAHT